MSKSELHQNLKLGRKGNKLDEVFARLRAESHAF